MKKLFTITFVALFAVCLNAQTFKFEWQNPKPQGNDLNDVVFLGTNGILAVGNAGVVQKSTDGGSKWDISCIDTSGRDILSAFFFDNSKGVVSGRAGLLMKTTDAGKSWTSLNSGTTEDLLDLEFVNADTGYAVGTKGTILKTKDGGKSWVASTYGSSSVYKITVVNAANIFIGSGNTSGRMAKSTDFGATWKNITPSTITSGVYAYCFLNDSTGFVGSSDDNIFKTTDGGTTWVKKTNQTSNIIYDIKFISATEGYAVDSKGNIFKSTDAGESWTSVKIPYQKLMAITGNSTVLYTVGVASSFYRSDDKGATWNSKIDFITQQPLRQVSFIDAKNGFACGGSTTAADSIGFMIKTTDGGASWTQLPFNFKTQMYTFSMPTSDIWYVGGAANTIYKTTDGGKTFVKQTSPVTTATHVYWTSAFRSKDLGYMAGNSGKMVKTTDGGTTWKEITTNFGTSTIFKMAMPDTGTIIIGGLSAKLSKSTDGGANWTALTPGIAGTIFAVKFKDAKLGYVGAGNASVAKTTDGGATWTPQYMPSSVASSASIWGIAFTDSAYWAITVNGEICKTTNGGTTWTVASRLTTSSLFDCDAKGNNVWFVGNGGAIVKASPATTSDVYENVSVADKFDLLQNYPNPFNPSTTIKYSVPADGKVSLKIYNVLGKEIATLVNQTQSAGSYSVNFNASELPSGIYFYQLTSGNSASVKKMMLLK